MGGTVSKTARKLPTKPRPSWAGATTPMASPLDAARPSPATPAGVSEKRTEAIDRDARDPQFMANLSALGQVKVDHHMSTFRTSNRMQNMLQSQQLSGKQASSSTSTRNRILAGNMVDVLEERKFIATRKELERLAEKNDLDVDVLESVAQCVSSPSILEGSRRTVVDEDGEERVTMLATWVDCSKLVSNRQV